MIHGRSHKGQNEGRSPKGGSTVTLLIVVALSEPQNVEQGISNDELGVPDVGAVNMQRSAVQVLDNLFNLVGVLRTCFNWSTLTLTLSRTRERGLDDPLRGLFSEF